MSMKLSRGAYAKVFGPTTGDRVRLADTELFVEVEKDHTTYGEEIVFATGKTARDGMGVCPIADRKTLKAADLVITNALIIDHWGIVKADIAIREGKIVGIGKAGNPLIQAGVDPDLIIGPGTEVYSAEGSIVTPGLIDAHVHWICPQLCWTAMQAGFTTLLGGGSGPNTGTRPRPARPAPGTSSGCSRRPRGCRSTSPGGAKATAAPLLRWRSRSVLVRRASKSTRTGAPTRP